MQIESSVDILLTRCNSVRTLCRLRGELRSCTKCIGWWAHYCTEVEIEYCDGSTAEYHRTEGRSKGRGVLRYQSCLYGHIQARHTVHRLCMLDKQYLLYTNCTFMQHIRYTDYVCLKRNTYCTLSVRGHMEGEIAIPFQSHKQGPGLPSVQSQGGPLTSSTQNPLY